MIKHNKKKNAGIVYEQLISLTTRLAVNKQKEAAGDIVSLIKRHFVVGSELNKERQLFETALSHKNLSQESAKQLIEETIKQAKEINSKKLEKEKNSLIEDVGKTLGKDLFKIPLKEYKILASLQVLFDEERQGYKYTTPAERTKIRNSLLERFTTKETKSQDLIVDNFTYKVLLKNFNNRYSKLLNEDQKIILNAWNLSKMTGDSEALKKVLTERINKIKTVLAKNQGKFKTVLGDENKTLLKEAYSDLVSFDISNINEDSIYRLMRYCDVSEDLEANQ